jgi:hypothetical protein
MDMSSATISPASPDFPLAAAAITPSLPDSNATSEIRNPNKILVMKILNEF